MCCSITALPCLESTVERKPIVRVWGGLRERLADAISRCLNFNDVAITLGGIIFRQSI
jgi:hypothetical protein